MIMVAPRTTLRYLRKYEQYLNTFPRNQRSIYFEKLIAQTFAGILNLPFYSSNNDDVNVRHRVTWCGSDIEPSAAPPGPDAIARAYEFQILIEPTLKTGSNQWSQEFAASIRHGQDYVNQYGLTPTEVYVTLVAPKLHIDTLRSIRQQPRPQLNVIPIEVSSLIDILGTSIMAFSMRHLELRKLFNQICDCVNFSSSIPKFRESLSDTISRWQEDVLKLERNAFIGVKSYEVMRKIGRGHIGTSEILDKLQRHPLVTQYLKIIDERILPAHIQESLIQQSLASQLGKTLEGEELFCPVSRVDYKSRQEKLIRVVEGRSAWIT